VWASLFSFSLLWSQEFIQKILLESEVISVPTRLRSAIHIFQRDFANSDLSGNVAISRVANKQHSTGFHRSHIFNGVRGFPCNVIFGRIANSIIIIHRNGIILNGFSAIIISRPIQFDQTSGIFLSQNRKLFSRRTNSSCHVNGYFLTATGTLSVTSGTVAKCIPLRLPTSRTGFCLGAGSIGPLVSGGCLRIFISMPAGRTGVLRHAGCGTAQHGNGSRFVIMSGCRNTAAFLCTAAAAAAHFFPDRRAGCSSSGRPRSVSMLGNGNLFCLGVSTYSASHCFFTLCSTGSRCGSLPISVSMLDHVNRFYLCVIAPGTNLCFFALLCASCFFSYLPLSVGVLKHGYFSALLLTAFGTSSDFLSHCNAGCRRLFFVIAICVFAAASRKHKGRHYKCRHQRFFVLFISTPLSLNGDNRYRLI